MSKSISPKAPDLDFNSPRLIRHRKVRNLKDQAAKLAIGLGGISVIVTIMLIFFYLLYEVAPLFKSAEAEQVSEYLLPESASGSTLYTAIEEQGEKAIRLTETGKVIFFNTADGSIHSSENLPLPDDVMITSISAADPSSRTLALGLSNGGVLLFKHSYNISYPNDKRLISPYIEYPFGEMPIILDELGHAITLVSLNLSEEAILLVGANEKNQLYATQFTKEEDFLSGEVRLEPETLKLPPLNYQPEFLLAEPGMRWIFVTSKQHRIQVLDLFSSDVAAVNSSVSLGSNDSHITDMRLLLGGSSVLITESNGAVSQWFMVRNKNNDYSFERVREFQHTLGKIKHLSIEHRRKGFAVVNDKGNLALFNSTAHAMSLVEQISNESLARVTLSPRSDFALIETESGAMHWWQIENEHPEISVTALWGKVWYEGYEEPEYIWQSSAANNDFEPKYSLAPLAFGTLKAAFYAMLVAMPLAICGALYTAYFMAPRLRRKVKPSIELMEALPTVILGFLAGLFFAPFMEENLPGVFACLIITPLAILIFGYVWANLPSSIRHSIPEGWDPALLIPVVLLAGWFSMEISTFLEVFLFDGDMRRWLTHEAGIDFDQRNALVVGAAMGFAVIPTIFSITEDAVFSVPKHLTYGSLALGATQWQTMVRVIIPTASPGIFSAVMIGMGRAVGETMIVLMATGNTPIMDMNIFEGMRTLSANIAVEMPESEVGGTHFRILFLAAFVLFLFTFVVNTFAEWIRHRLRNKYSVI